jgi:hypothetical protein
MKSNTQFRSYLAYFFLEWETFQTKVVEKIKTHILCSVTFFRKSCRLWDNVDKYCRAGQTTDGNMAHAHCMLDTWGYKYTHSDCVILIAFPQQQWLPNTPPCYVIRTLPVFVHHIWGYHSGFIEDLSLLPNDVLCFRRFDGMLCLHRHGLRDSSTVKDEGCPYGLYVALFFTLHHDTAVGSVTLLPLWSVTVCF